MDCFLIQAKQSPATNSFYYVVEVVSYATWKAHMIHPLSNVILLVGIILWSKHHLQIIPNHGKKREISLPPALPLATNLAELGMPLPNTKKYKYKSLFGKFIVQNPPWRRNPTPPHLLKSTYVTLIKSLHQLCRQCKNHLRLVIFCTHGTDWKELPSGEVVSTVSSCLINAAF